MHVSGILMQINDAAVVARNLVAFSLWGDDAMPRCFCLHLTQVGLSTDVLTERTQKKEQ